MNVKTLIFSIGTLFLALQSPPTRAEEAKAAQTSDPDAQVYLLGPQDQISIKVIDFDEIADKPIRIDPGGFIDLPLIGTVHAAGLTVRQLRDVLMPKLKEFVHEPDVTVNVVEFHSQPVSILGAVNAPGVHQIEGPRHLLEMISLAGGVRADAGSQVTIARQKACGPLPLPNARTKMPGDVSVAELQLDDLLKAVNPEANILVCARDTITISTAELLYVIGEVKKPGGFTLHSNERMSVLQALSLAEGWIPTAAPKRAHIVRVTTEGEERILIPADLKAIFDGKAKDIRLQAGDILYVPNNASRSLTIRSAETALQIATGLVIFHR